MKKQYTQNYLVLPFYGKTVLALLFFNFLSSTLLGNTPTLQASKLVVSNKTCSSIKVSFRRGNGTRAFVTCRPASESKVNPTDGVKYTGSSSYSFGNNLGTQNYAIGYFKDSSFTINLLKQKKQYTIEIFEWDSASNAYLTSISATVSDSTHFLQASPVANLIGDSCSHNATALFRANVSASYQITKYRWQFAGQDTTTTADSLLCRITKGGVQQYTLIPSPNLNCTASYFTGANKLLIIPTPNAKPWLDPEGPCLRNGGFDYGENTTLEAVPKAAFARKWDFGDGTWGTMPAGDHYYSPVKDYKIMYVASTW